MNPAQLQSSNTTANFGVAAIQEISPRKATQQSGTPWIEDNSPLDDVNRFVDGYTGWRRDMLIDWLALPTKDLKALQEFVKKYETFPSRVSATLLVTSIISLLMESRLNSTR